MKPLLANGLADVPIGASESQVERSVVAALLTCNGQPLPANLAYLAKHAPISFIDERLGIIAKAVFEVLENHSDETKERVIRKLTSIAQIENAGGVLFIEKLAGESVQLDLAEDDAVRVRKNFEARRAGTVFEDGKTALEDHPELARSIMEVVVATFQDLAFDRVLENLASRRFYLTEHPPEPRGVYIVTNAVICTPGNLTAITAQAKAGKSAFIGAMMAAALTEHPGEVDTFGVRASNPEQFAIVHFDSEQSKFDHWRLVERAIKRARRDDMPDWLHSYCTTGFSADQTWSLLKQTVRRAAKVHGGIHSVLIDGIADLCNDVNNAAECNALVASLHDMAIEFDCPIAGVVHFNPGTDKSRGHLGSQLERKCESNLRLEKNGEITTVWSEKQRRAPIFKDSGPKFRFDPVARMHVTVDPEDDPAQQAEVEGLRATRDDVFQGRHSMRYSEIISALKVTVKRSEKTAERRLAKWIKHRLVEKSVAGLYVPMT
jgi:hypothetical protein